MKEVFGIPSSTRNAQFSDRIRPRRITSTKVKRGPAKGKVIGISVRASVVMSMMRLLKERKFSKERYLSPEELTRRQQQLHFDSYRLSSAMNSGDLK